MDAIAIEIRVVIFSSNVNIERKMSSRRLGGIGMRLTALQDLDQVDEGSKPLGGAFADRKCDGNRHLSRNIHKSIKLSIPRPLHNAQTVPGEAEKMATEEGASPVIAEKVCICYRAETMLVCINCKATSFGRIGRTCPLHPNVNDI